MTEIDRTNPIIDEKTGMATLDGFLFNPVELEKTCEEIGLNNRVKDLEILCKEKNIKVTYHDLKALAEGNKVYMYHSPDNYDVIELAKFFEKHPYMFAEISIIKATDEDCLPYKLVLHTICTLTSFYIDGNDPNGHAWIHLVSKCMSDFDPVAIEASRQIIDEKYGQECLLNVFVD